jgi:hypothetical protein
MPNNLYDAIEAYIDKENETVQAVIKEFRSHRHKTQPWKVVPAARVKKIWHESATLGFIRDLKGLERIETQVLENIHRLSINTTFMGHTPWKPGDLYDDFDLTEEERDMFAEYAIDERGTFRLSDYAMEPLKKLAVDLYEAQESGEKLVLLDRIFNFVHARSDLASWFIEGGTRTLNEITYGDGDETRLAA